MHEASQKVRREKEGETEQAPEPPVGVPVPARKLVPAKQNVAVARKSLTVQEPLVRAIAVEEKPDVVGGPEWIQEAVANPAKVPVVVAASKPATRQGLHKAGIRSILPGRPLPLAILEGRSYSRKQQRAVHVSKQAVAANRVETQLARVWKQASEVSKPMVWAVRDIPDESVELGVDTGGVPMTIPQPVARRVNAQSPWVLSMVDSVAIALAVAIALHVGINIRTPAGLARQKLSGLSKMAGRSGGSGGGLKTQRGADFINFGPRP